MGIGHIFILQCQAFSCGDVRQVRLACFGTSDVPEFNLADNVKNYPLSRKVSSAVTPYAKATEVKKALEDKSAGKAGVLAFLLLDTYTCLY